MALGWIFFWAQCELLCACYDYICSHVSTTHTHTLKSRFLSNPWREDLWPLCWQCHLARCQQMLGVFQRKEDITSASRFDLYEVFAYAFREEWQITSTSVTSAESPMTPLDGLQPWTWWPSNPTSVCGADTFQLYSMCAAVAAVLHYISTASQFWCSKPSTADIQDLKFCQLLENNAAIQRRSDYVGQEVRHRSKIKHLPNFQIKKKHCVYGRPQFTVLTCM